MRLWTDQLVVESTSRYLWKWFSALILRLIDWLIDWNHDTTGNNNHLVAPLMFSCYYLCPIKVVDECSTEISRWNWRAFCYHTAKQNEICISTGRLNRIKNKLNGSHLGPYWQANSSRRYWSPCSSRLRSKAYEKPACRLLEIPWSPVTQPTVLYMLLSFQPETTICS